MRRLAAGIVLVALAGCGSSPPTHFFTLDATAPQTQVKAKSDAPIQVASVHIPAALDRLSMVRGEQDHQLSISDQDRWGAFDDMARRVLTQDLPRRLPQGTALPPDAQVSAMRAVWSWSATAPLCCWNKPFDVTGIGDSGAEVVPPVGAAQLFDGGTPGFIL